MGILSTSNLIHDTYWNEAGSKDSFAVQWRAAMDPDPEHAPREHAGTWMEFRFWCGGRNLCDHLQGGHSFDTCVMYGGELADWLRHNWTELLHETRIPFLLTGESVIAGSREALQRSETDFDELLELQDWQSRHSLRSAAAGSVVPDIMLVRTGSDMDISWVTEPSSALIDVSFTSAPGSVRVDVQQVASILLEVVRSVAASSADWSPPAEHAQRLRALAGITSERVGDWEAIVERLRSDNRSAHGLLGDDEADSIVLATHCSVPVMFGALAPDIALDDALMLADEIAAAPRPAPGAESLGSPAAFTGEKPWKQAYGLAGRLIERHPSWFASPPIDIEAFLADLDIRIVERELPTSGVQAVSFGGPQHAPTIVLNTNSPLNQSLTSRRFILAHELFHLLHDQDRGGTVAVASGPWTSPRVEQRANAFAAMLLMPEHLMFREMIGVDRTKLSSLETLASRFETGIIATISHAKNLGWLTWGQRQYLLQALDR